MTLEQGKDLSELFGDNDVKDFTMTFKDKLWTFRYKAVNWQAHFQAVEVGWETTLDDKGKPEMMFNAAQYYENLLMLALVSGPGGHPITRIELRALHPDIIGQLITLVPSPKLTKEINESKKESGTSSTETEEPTVSTSGSEPESNEG